MCLQTLHLTFFFLLHQTALDKFDNFNQERKEAQAQWWVSTVPPYSNAFRVGS